MTGYPPGTSRNDLRRAGIIDDRPVCDVCENKIGDESDHEDGCENEGLDGQDLAQIEYEDANSYDRYEL